MNTKISRRSILMGVAVLVLAAVAFGAGAWVGAEVVGKFHGYQVLPRACANANLLHRKLLLLDKEDSKGLREEINRELDGELLGMCTLAKERSGSSSGAVATAKMILQRIAKYRTERPPSYPAAYSSRVPADAQKTIQACLADALATPVK
jgi:hypothetical protein